MKAAKGIKSLVKSSLTELVARLPIGGRQAIFERLSSQFGIVGVQATGEYGKVLSAVGVTPSSIPTLAQAVGHLTPIQ